ncbi:AAA-domain-containing protein [Xylariomycetidae sp. FL0641]|nr:AAA-domain-containing protein [Xylariomycetidae sp. FL0641]
MWTSNQSTLQKTYDESYLKCSTAVYYESQGDEKEAMNCWKNALEQIRSNPVTKRQPNYSPRSETERTLLESLHELEVQCKERIDLLEALRLSRADDPTIQGTPSARSEDGPEGRTHSNTPERGWIGNGTIPAITYTELSKPPLPKRPSFPSRTSSEQAVVGGGRATTSDQALSSSSTAAPPTLPPYATPSASARADVTRSVSPDKRTMRTTLRSGKLDKSSKSSRPTPSKITKGPGASKAATLAWNQGTPREKTASDANNIPFKSVSSESRRTSYEQPRKTSTPQTTRWDSHTRRLVTSPGTPPLRTPDARSSPDSPALTSSEFPFHTPSALALGAASSALGALSVQDRREASPAPRKGTITALRSGSGQNEPGSSGIYGALHTPSTPRGDVPVRRKPVESSRASKPNSTRKRVSRHKSDEKLRNDTASSDDGRGRVDLSSSHRRKTCQKESPIVAESDGPTSDDAEEDEEKQAKTAWEKKKKAILKSLPPGVDEAAAKAIVNEIVVQGDEVHWSDVAGLEIAKNALREAVVYPFLRPDLFMGLREPARGMLLFGPPGTGKTMLARAVATESKSTFFSISASSLTSKYLGESEKLVRALFGLAKIMAPSIIFVDEIDSLLSQRSGSGEHEATRRIKTEFLIQWSDLQRAAAGRETGSNGMDGGDPNRVLVLAATNLPWAIDEAARRRFVRRQYIPLPEPETRATQLKNLLSQQKHNLTDADIAALVDMIDGFSGSDITALAKDAAMGPLRSLGDALLHMTMDQIRPIELADFEASLRTIRPSVSKEGLKEYEDWAKQFGERGG